MAAPRPRSVTSASPPIRWSVAVTPAFGCRKLSSTTWRAITASAARADRDSVTAAPSERSRVVLAGGAWWKTSVLIVPSPDRRSAKPGDDEQRGRGAEQHRGTDQHDARPEDDVGAGAEADL